METQWDRSIEGEEDKEEVVGVERKEGDAEEQVVFQSKNRYNCYRGGHSVQSFVALFFMLSQRRS